MTPSEASTTKRGVVYLNDFRSLVWKSQQLHRTLEYQDRMKMESIRKWSNFNFQWTKTLYQNNLKHIEYFFTFFKG